MKKLITFIALVLAFAVSAQTPPAAPAKPAYPKNALAGGGPTGTYTKVTQQYLAQCNADRFFTPMVQPGGSPATVSDIMGNFILGGIAQLDVVWVRGHSNPDVKENLKVLVPLHKEQVHFIALSKDPKVGGFLGFNQDSVKLKDVAALKGFNIGAAGGSKFTAEAIQTLGKVDFKIKEYKTNGDVLEAIEKGEVVAGVFVGGTPMDDISALDPRKYRILPFDDATITNLKAVYEPRTIQYDNFGTGGFKSVQVQSYLFVNDFKGKAMSAKMLELRKCITENVNDIAETPNAHGVWREIAKNMENKEVRWPAYVGRP